MRFTDIFIRRPVLALVVSALILVLGLRSMTSLAILQYPRTQNAIVTVATTYAARGFRDHRRLHHHAAWRTLSRRPTASTT